MSVDRTREAMSILGDALDQAEGRRDAFVTDRCGDDSRLLREVRSLLGAHSRAGAFMEEPATPDPSMASGVVPGAVIGGFRIVRLIGSGGMSDVYEAEQSAPRRRVAFKVLRGPWNPVMLRRFTREAETLARLQHPSIATVHASGIDRDGGRCVPFIAMELVEPGRPLTEWARESHLSRRARIALLRDVCHAVMHAHQKGIIHRDLKPSNILVDQQGRPKVIDFGIARIVGARADATLTRADAVMGTLAWMSPEQCGGGPDAVDARSDVYALGAIGYELACGRPPLVVEELPLAEAVDRIRNRPPVPPSRVDPDVPRELEAVLLRALHKQPEGRYPGAASFADDLDRFLDDRPVEARPPTVLTTLHLFARRNRALVTATAAIAVTLLAATIISTVFGVTAEWRREQAEQSQRAALIAAAEAERSQYAALIAAAEAAMEAGEYARLRDNLAKSPERRRGWEWHFLDSRSEPADAVLTMGGRGSQSAFSRDERDLITVTRGGRVVRWSVDRPGRGELLREIPGGAHTVDAASDGSIVAIGGFRGEIHLVPGGGATLPDGEPDRVITAHRGLVVELALSADGASVASIGRNGDLAVHRVADGERLLSMDLRWSENGEQMGVGQAISIARDGALVVGLTPGQIVCVDPDGSVRWRRVLDGESTRDVVAVGERVAVATTAGTLRWFRLEDGADTGRVIRHPAPLWSVAIDPLERWVVTGASDQRVRLFDPDQGVLLTTLPGHTNIVRDVRLSSDGERLASTAWDGTVRLWSIPERLGVDGVRCSDVTVQGVAFDRGSDRLAAAADDGRVTLWNWRTREPLWNVQVHDAPLRCIVFHPDGARITCAGSSGWMFLLDAATGHVLQRHRAHPSRIYGLDISPDGRRLATGSADRTAKLWSLEEGERGHWREDAELEGHGGAVWRTVFSPDGRTVATAAWDHLVRTWSADTGHLRHVLDGHEDTLYALAFSPDGALLASGGRDQRIVLWDPVNGREVRRFDGHGQFITGLEFLPDGSRLVASSWFGRMLVWDHLGTETMLALRAPYPSSPRDMAVSPDGTCLAAACADGYVRLWTLDRPRPPALVTVPSATQDQASSAP